MDEPEDEDLDAPYTGPDDYKPPRISRSSRHRYIEAMARIYVDRRYGLKCNTAVAMVKGGAKSAITRYAKNWLAEHGGLPQGVHVCRDRRGTRIAGTFEVDFTALWGQVPSPVPAPPPAPERA